MQLKVPNSVGYQYVNATLGNPTEHIDKSIGETRKNYSPFTANVNEPHAIYKTYHRTPSGNIPPDQPITVTFDDDYSHITSSGVISGMLLTNTYDEEDFFNYHPTRITYRSADDATPSGLLGDMTGLTYVRDWSKVDSSGVVIIPEQDVFIVNQNLSSPVESVVKSTVIYSTAWELLDSYDYGSGNQNYNTVGAYETITNPSGTHTFKFDPIDSTLQVCDYINLDAAGDVQVLPSTYYTVTRTVTDYVTSTTLAMSGVNPYNDVDVMHSNYFVQYQYRKMDYPKQVSTSSAQWDIQKHASSPVFTSVPINYNGTVVSHGIAITPSGSDFALRVDPRDIRPGFTATIKFDYIQYNDTNWNNDVAFSLDLGTDSEFLNTAASGIHVYKDYEEITEWFDPVLSGVSFAYIPARNMNWAPPLTVRCYYNARKTYSSVVGVQSFHRDKTGVDPYPRDYMIEGSYLVPFTILPITESDTYVNNALVAATSDAFEVTTNLSFDGIAYDEDKNCFWMIESNNTSLYKVRPSDGAVTGKWNIFKTPNYVFDEYKSVASGVLDEFGKFKHEYPFVSHELDAERSVTGCVYFKDFLYINSNSGTGIVATANGTGHVIGGDGLYRLDTYADRVMDVEYNTDGTEKHPHFTWPTGVTGVVDLTMDEVEDIRAVVPSAVKKIGLHYDYVVIDSDDEVTRGTVYYREQYEAGVDVGIFKEWGA